MSTHEPGSYQQLAQAYAELLATVNATSLPTDYDRAADALVSLREVYVELVDQEHADHPSMGCCGCESWQMDIVTELAPPEAPHGEGYCWDCVPELYDGVTYTVLPGRERADVPLPPVVTVVDEIQELITNPTAGH
jgi:hypothetical protein